MLGRARRLAALAAPFVVAFLLVQPAAAQIKPRLTIAFDTSGSMALDMDGVPTFGDGVTTGCTSSGGILCGTNCTAGTDTDCDGQTDDSRIYIAKEAVRNMVLSTGDLEFALARFSQTQSTNRSCLNVNTYECNILGPYVTSYGNPQCNSGALIPSGGCPFDWASLWPGACRPGTGGRPPLRMWSTGGSPTACTNYRGECTGGDVLVGFPDTGAYAGMTNAFGILKWVDGQETNFTNFTGTGDFCRHATTGDCELRPEGPTPLEGILIASRNYMVPIRAADPASACRPYSIILMTDGVESCAGSPVTRAGTILSADGIRTYVVGMSIASAADRATLNSIAVNGGTASAYFADDPTSLSIALSTIVADSLLVEVCNNIDDDCDGLVDEGFVKYCNRPGGITATTLCVDPGETVCDGIDDNCNGLVDEGLTNACGTCGAAPAEVCDGIDNDCDGIIDEGGVCGGCIPSAEICDGIDNDCDGSIDEGLSRTCGTGVGACTTGTQICTAGTWGACSGTGPSAEVCDGIDNDCDGVTDGITRPCGSDVGECQRGLQLCTSGPPWGTCTGEIGPVAEICDGLDNDCDGTIDEGDPGGGGMCGTSIGACTPGTLHCVGAALTCSGGTSPGPETCNGVDDDCDGAVDDGVPSMGPCGSAVGECREGARRCVGGSFTCVGARGPGAEVCDGLDNDCDGSTDEGNPGGGVACGDSTGECTAGTTLCVGGALTCDGAVGPAPEVCNALDDDCDGLADDGIPVGAPCGSDVGECSPGRNVCRAGALVCEGAIEPIPEVCDTLDNDCDGMIDEGLGLGGPCGTDEGLCMAGMMQCIDGREICVGEVPPTRELCDCDDNDCDGTVDEPPDTGTLCPPGSSCVDCSCALPCVPTEFGFGCPTGRAASVQADGSCFCVAARCNDTDCATETMERDGSTLCTPDSTDVSECVCKNNECTFPCDGVVCPEGLVCNPRDRAGRCMENTCRGLGCPSGELCNTVTGECEADPCDAVTCGSGEACREGTCEPSCATVDCAAGQRCERGLCVDDPCVSMTCLPGETCDPADGSCVEDRCVDVRCSPGSICNALTGECDLDPCLTLSCPEGQVCEDGECAIEVPPTADAGVDGGFDAGPALAVGDRVLATGGGGCVCAVPGAGPSGGNGSPAGALALALGLLGLLGFRRRRPFRARGAGALAMVAVVIAVALLASGCDVKPYCLDCADGGVDAGPPDAGPSMDTGPMRPDAGPDAGPADGGPDGCVPGALERCNGIDDNCDGTIDEGIDITTDVNNCGACGMACAPPHAFGECVDSTCGIASCDVGWLDLDDDITNGCEYRCIATETDDAICDLRDDDCDGVVDEDVDFDNDPSNCGSCGTVCRFAHGAGDCVSGICTLGACDTGFWDIDGVASTGCEYACARATPPTETCNAVDDDCDGTVDEGDPAGGGSCGSSVGACMPGTEHCMGGTLVCVGEVIATTEICNGVDDDCDGTVDQGDPGGGGSCGTDVGECTPGTRRCVGGSVVCVGATTGGAESCDALDNDCDGMIDEGNPGGGGSCGSSVGRCAGGIETCTGGTLVCTGGIGPTLETCNSIDDDCDGATDEDFLLLTDPTNCGSCGTVCSYPNAIAACTGGSCGLVACLTGFVNLDGLSGNGCEYACSFNGAEICNGLDDDCDGMTDEGLTPPSTFCNPNGVCAGTTAACAGAGGWTCTYSAATYEPSEATCDGLDNDCDGGVDEPFPLRGTVCTNGSSGSCLRLGVYACNAAGDGVACNAPSGGSGSPELCNGVDDDCDGAIDDGVGIIASGAIATVRIPRASAAGFVRVMTYEASRPDATSAVAGTMGALACSTANRVPWTNVNWTEARDACCALNASGSCAATGWRLCEAADWQAGCESSTTSCAWSYNASCSSSQPTACNGEEYDCLPAGGDQDCLLPTGSATFPNCRARWGAAGNIYDLSGNVKEWTNTQRGSATVHEIRGGSYNNVEAGRTCGFDFTVGSNSFAFPNTGFRCCYYE